MLLEKLSIFTGLLKLLFTGEYFWLLHCFYILSLNILVIYVLPGGSLSIQRPLTGIIFSYIFITLTFLLNIFIISNRDLFKIDLSESELKREKYTKTDIITANMFIIFFYNFIFVLSGLPAAIIASSSGGFPLQALSFLLICAFLSGSTSGLMVYYFREVFTNYSRFFVYSFSIFYILAGFFTGQSQAEFAFLNLRFYIIIFVLSITLLFELIIDLRRFIFNS